MRNRARDVDDMKTDGDIWRRVHLTIVLLSSINYGDLVSADHTSGGIVGRVTPIRTVLSSDVNVSLQIPGYLVNASAPRTLSLTVMEHRSHVRLRTFKVDVVHENLTVRLPCDLFDHAGQYDLTYKFSGHGPTGKLNSTINLNWGKMTVEAPRNHTTLTRFGYIWVYHDRSCLPKSRRYRDKINLYYLKGNQKVMITHRIVRKVKNGKQKGPRRRIRMGFSCDLFDIAQTYFFEYVSGFHNASFARSAPVFVRWSKHSLYTPTKTIFPCSNSFVVSFNAPECHKTTDVIRVYEQNSGRFVTERPALPGHTAVFFPCTLFNDYIKGYCFRYVSKATLNSKERVQASLCVSTLEPGKSIYDGWSSWSYWNLCSNSCGQGRKYRYRFCLSLTTSKDKNNACLGRAVMTKPCVLRPCPETRNACACGCRLTEPEGMITSSPQLFKKPGRSQCTWRINVPGNKRVKLWFDALKLDGDSIFIRDGNDSSANLLAKIKADDYEDTIVSSGNSMYIHYYHNGKWINGTRRGFTASYKVQVTSVAAVFASSRKNLGTAEISFLAIFIVGILIMGSLLMIVFLKLRRQHSFSASSGSSTTSESTIRSAGTPSPLEDEACINEPLKPTKDTRTKKPSKGKREHKERHKERRERRREITCEGNPIPRCSCAVVSEFDSGSGTNSYSDGSPQRHNSDIYRTLERTIDDYTVCDCPMCLRHQREYHTHEHFGSPEKKYYGDWMIQESYMEDPRQNYRNSFPQYV